jgi:transcriptional regulator with XRE-family HTH domain
MHAFLTKPDLQFLPIPIPDFGAAIRRRRFALGLNCSRAAASVGIKKHEWQLLEHGYIPTPENENFLRALAGTLEIRVDDLVTAIAPFGAYFANTRDDNTMEEQLKADQSAA